MSEYYVVPKSSLDSVADAIREKGGTSAQLTFPQGFVDAIAAISGGGGGISIDDFASGAAPTGVITLNATSIANYAFYYKDKITQAIAPNVTSVGEYAFDYCSGLTLVQMPNLTTTKVFSFGYIASTSCIMVFPKLSACAARTFARGHIGTVDIGPNCSSLLADTFYNNNNNAVVDVLILRHSGSVVTAATEDTIKGLRAVYVPSALISAYTSATNWATKISAGTITLQAIEGSQYENYYADGTPIES
jgi:hypothetical protein